MVFQFSTPAERASNPPYERKNNFTIDDLSRSQEAQLRTPLAHTGDDGVETIQSLDDAIEDLLNLRVSCTGRDSARSATLATVVQTARQLRTVPDWSGFGRIRTTGFGLVKAAS